MTDAALLPQRAVGNRGLSLSILGFGALQLGDYFVRMSDEVASATIAAAWAAGIRYFDTAPLYGKGLSEHRLGGALRRYPRDQFVLSTKVGRRMVPDPVLSRDPEHRGLPFRPVIDWSYDGTKRCIEDSLNRLGLSHVDIVYMHDLEPRTYGTEYPAVFREAIGGCYRALDAMRAERTIRAIGGGINEAEASVQLMRAADLDCLMLAGRYTLLEQQTLNDVMPLALEKNVAIVIAQAFNSGVLATGVTPAARYNNRALEPEIAERVGALEAVCARHDVPLAAAALQFVLAHPAVVSVVAGMSSPADVALDRELVMRSIPAGFWGDLRDSGLIRADAPVPAEEQA